MEEPIGPRELEARADAFRIFDIRKEPDDRKIPGSISLEGASLESGDDVPFGREEPIVFYCGSGNSSGRIAKMLRDRGYNAVALDGGYKGWKEAGLPTEPR